MSKKVIKLPKPLDYQKDIIDLLTIAGVKFVTFLKSRQSGGSYLNKMLVIKWSLENRNERIGYITPTLKLGKLFYKELCNSIEPYIQKTNSADLIIELITGSTIQFFSAESADSIRGFQFHRLIIDEAAYMKADFFDLILRPTILIKGKSVVLCSTPNTATGFFHQLYYLGMDPLYPQYKSKRITIYDNPFISTEEIEAIKASVPSRVFKQEYEAEFLEDEGAVFSNYKNCIVTNTVMNKQYYAAIDWAKSNDYTVLTIMNSLGQVVHIYRVTGLDYTVQVDVIAKQLTLWKPIETISEENNIGAVVNELLKKAYSGKLRQVTLTNELKKEMVERLIVDFETEAIGIPDDKELLNELSWFSAEYNPKTQKVTYGAKSNLHDDMVISLAYANYYRKKERKYVIR